MEDKTPIQGGKTMKKLTIITLALVVAMIAGSAHAGGTMMRPYVKFGSLLSGPGADDLGYTDVDGANLDEYLKMDKGNYGLGAQFLFDVKETPTSVYRAGFDIGIQSIFKSKFDTGSSDLDFIYESYDEDSEYSFYMLGVGEYSPNKLPFVLQAGLGIHYVYWSWASNHDSKYSYEYDATSGSGVNIGFLLAGGLDLRVNEKMAVPVMLRIDSIFRYGTETTVSLLVGLDYHFGL